MLDLLLSFGGLFVLIILRLFHQGMQIQKFYTFLVSCIFYYYVEKCFVFFSPHP